MSVRKLFIVTLAVGILSAPLVADAQQPAKIPQVGWLTPGRCPGSHPSPTADAILEGLRERGYVEGKNIVIECRVSDGTADRYRALMANLVRLNVNMIFAVSSSAVRAAANATTTIPIVAIDLETDPVASRLAASLARPGGNITGVFLDLPEVNGKWLELLREAVPGLSRAAALWDTTMDPTPLRAAEAAARSLRVQLQIVQVRSPNDFDTAFGTAARGHARALIVMQSPLTDVHRKRIADLALRGRLPAIAMFPSFAEEGGLMSYGPDIRHLFRYVASFVDKILKGVKPGDLPIERPSKFELVVNLKTAKALGLTIPQSILIRADQVIHP